MLIYEKAYAKINLALAVGEEKEGYHEVQNVMVPIQLYDELFFQKSKEIQIDCEAIPLKENICYRAALLFKEKFQIDEGVSIILNKNIPIMAGLGGGSSDAAAVLRGLNRLFEVNASKETLYELAVQLGSDVPFFLYNKGALCSGRGELVCPLGFDLPHFSLLLIKPKFGFSTKEIYQKYVFDGVFKGVWIKRLLDALKNNDLDAIEQNIFNDLEKTALNHSPELKAIFERIEGLSYHPHISGSGPTIYVLDAKSIDLENVKAVLKDVDLYLLSTL